MKLQDIKAYEVVEEREVADLNSKGYLLKHKKSGARVLLLSNDDNNKVFSIGFRTPPADSTGVPHILEHSVLCGSKDFPVKDPFVELVKGSLNTFLNAMTFPDKTVYPVASCNDKDFRNLCHVYMDAVFYPNIYQREEIFKQEGWHYELETPEDKITYNGVVYNEMKGAFSSPEDVLDRVTYNSLYPDTAYALESGGDPEVIPNLSYQEFLDFHGKYYHPSNCYIYLYGDCDMAERLMWLDEKYLSHFDEITVDSEITLQKPFEKMVEVKKSYSITEEESLEDQTYLSYNVVIDTSLNKELYLAFQIIEYSLLAAPGAPLKQALIDKNIGKDIMSTYENGIYQPYFSVIAKNTNVEAKEEFMNTIREVLLSQVQNGLDKKALEAGINYYEFKYREADYGSYPKGLMYGLQAFDSWLYDDTTPFMHIEANDTFAYIKSQIDKGYFENLIEKYLLDNPHSSIVMIVPEKGLTAKKDAKVESKLKEYKATLSKEQIEKLVEDTKALEKYQEEPSSPEELKTIPLLKIKDIDRNAEKYINDKHVINDTVYLHHNIFTNGIGYLGLLFDMKNIPMELIPYAGLLKNILGLVNTENYAYGDLFNEINRYSGGIHCNIATYADAHVLGEFVAKFEVRAKMMADKTDFIFKMIEEILFTSNLEDGKRINEIIAMMKSRMQMSLTSAGHSTTALRALSYFSNTSYFTELVSGFSFYRLVEEIEADFENKREDVVCKMKEVLTYLLCEDNLMIDFTGSEEAFSLLQNQVEKLKEKLNKEKLAHCKFDFPLEQKNEGFKTASQVQYVAMAGNYRTKGLPYTGALKVLRVIMGYDYLWNNIRVKGGAYGCMNSFTRIGDSYFVSYRDPNLEKTIAIYEKAAVYLESFSADEREMTKYVIGTISDMDVPLTPKSKGIRSLTAFLGNLTYKDAQKEREEVLNVTKNVIKGLAPYAKAVISENNLCVIGSEEKIKEQSQLFKTVENLFK
ncbi:MAG: insulinase family protein [Lachnospiraceae bacterium]|nr:insulinase family protein [Lachnospiraceae bacterium]